MALPRKPRSRGISTGPEAEGKQAEIAGMRRMCTAFQCWSFCALPSCRRDHRCLGDPIACFERYWERYPNTFHAWIVAAGEARATGLTMGQAMRAADEQARGGSGCRQLPWVRSYLKSFDNVAKSRGSR